jgi:hypothetical protein
VLKSLDFTGKIVYSMGCKATVRDVLLRLKNKWKSRLLAAQDLRRRIGKSATT